MEPERNRVAILIAFGALCAAVPPPTSAGTCNVPSPGQPTVGAAVRDTSCTTIQLAPGSFPENVVVDRTLALQGAGSGASSLEGYLAAAGSGSSVTLAALTVDGTAEGVAGCWNGLLSVSAGAEVVAGPDVVVLQSGMVGQTCRLFADGFESGGLLAWSAQVP